MTHHSSVKMAVIFVLRLINHVEVTADNPGARSRGTHLSQIIEVLSCDPNSGGRLLEFGLGPLSISVIPNKSQMLMWYKLLIPYY